MGHAHDEAVCHALKQPGYGHHAGARDLGWDPARPGAWSAGALPIHAPQRILAAEEDTNPLTGDPLEADDCADMRFHFARRVSGQLNRPGRARSGAHAAPATPCLGDRRARGEEPQCAVPARLCTENAAPIRQAG